MVLLVEESPLSRLLEACKKRCAESEDSEIVGPIASAIGDRRLNDFVDIIAHNESEHGWSTTAQYLIKALDYHYPAPLGSGLSHTKIECLKFREMFFALLGCTGYEPIPEPTTTLVKELADEESSVRASQKLTTIAKEQIEQQQTSLPPQAQQVYDLLGQTGKAMGELAKIKPELQDFLKAAWAQMATVRNRLKAS